jgi:hypothetical protein
MFKVLNFLYVSFFLAPALEEPPIQLPSKGIKTKQKGRRQLLKLQIVKIAFLFLHLMPFQPAITWHMHLTTGTLSRRTEFL